MPEATEAARAAVQRLQDEWDWPAPALVREIVAQGEAAVAPLMELLTPAVLEKSATEDRENALVYYAQHLLGETGSPAAIPPLVESVFGAGPGRRSRRGPLRCLSAVGPAGRHRAAAVGAGG